jgi:hypothetical protein
LHCEWKGGRLVTPEFTERIALYTDELGQLNDIVKFFRNQIAEEAAQMRLQAQLTDYVPCNRSWYSFWELTVNSTLLLGLIEPCAVLCDWRVNPEAVIPRINRELKRR